METPTRGILVSADELRAWTFALVTTTGTPPDIASDVADALAAADLRGVTTHGTFRLPVYVRLAEAGVLAVSIDGAGAQTRAALFGTSLETTESPADVQSVIGWQMQGSTDLGTAAEIWGWDWASKTYAFTFLWDSSGSVPSLDGLWIDQGTGMPSVLAMPLGGGYWVKNKSGSAQSVLYEGVVERSPSLDVPVDASMTRSLLMGQPLAADVPLKEDNTSLWADGAKANADLFVADEIWAWDPAMNGYVFTFLFDSGGTSPTADGWWVDQSTGLETTLVLDAGTGWWYHSKADPVREPGWVWTEPVPY